MKRACRSSRMLVPIGVIFACLLAGCSQTGGKWFARSPRSNNLFAADSSTSPTAGATQSRPTAKQKADVQMSIARSLEQHGQADQAIKVYEQVLKKDRRRVDAHHRLALLYDRKGDGGRSEPHYQAALDRDASNAEVWCDLGYSYYLRSRWAEAERALRKAVSIKPDLARAHNNLGLVLARTDQHDLARGEFLKAGCSEAEARTNLAYALVWDQQFTQAQREFAAALELDPALKSARDGLNKLDSVVLASSAEPIAVITDHKSGPGKTSKTAGRETINFRR